MVVDLENLSNVKTDEVIKFILENISDLVVITNDKFEIEIINDDAHKAITGYDDMDLTGKSLLETIHPKDRKNASGELRKLLKNGIFEGKTRLKCKNGEYVWLKIDGQTFCDTLGNKKIILIGKEFFKQRNFAKFRELKESEEMFRTIGEQSLMGISILQNDVFKYVNKQFAKIYGYTVDELLSWPKLEYQKLTHPDDLFFTADQARKKQIGENDVIKRYQFRGIKKSGETIWLEIFSKSISYEGYPADLIALIDVSEKRLAIQGLKDSEAKFRHLVSSSPAIIYTSDVSDDYGATFISENLKVLTGYSPEEFTSDIKFWLNHIHPDDKERIKAGLAELFVKNYHYHEYRFKFKDGTYHWVRDEVNLIKDENGTPIECIGYWSDITEQKLAEQKLIESEHNLKESEAKYRHLFNSTPYGIWLVNLKGTVIDCNISMNKFLSVVTREDLIGKNLRDILQLILKKGGKINIKELEETFIERFKLLLKQEYIDPIEVEVTRKDGKEFWLTFETSFVNLGNETLIQVFIKDITYHKENELKIKNSEEKLKILNKELEHLVEERTKELKLAKEKYQLITENVNDSIAVIDDDFNYEYLNKIFEETFGYNSSEIIGTNRIDLVHPEDMQLGIDKMKELFDKGESTLEFRVRKKDGNYIWIEIKGKVFYDNFNQRKALLVGRDITERKKTEQRLKESEEKYRTISENSLMGIAIVQENKVQYVNEAISNINEYTVQEMLDWSPMEFINIIHPEEQHFAIERVKKRQSGDLEIQPLFSYRLITKSGKTKWVDSLSKTINYRGKLASLNILLDITKRKLAEEKLRESEEKFRNITENSLMGIIITQDNEFKYFNEAMSNIYELTNEEIMKWTIREFMNKIHPDDRDYAVERLKKRLVDNSELSPFFSFRIITKSGKVKWVDSSTKPINFKGKLAHLSMILDITDRKEAEEKLKESELKLREQNIELKNLDEIKNDFITMAAHELKTPLISISGYTEYILTKHEDRLNEITPEIKKDLTIVQKNIKRLQNLMDQLLDVMKIESKKIKLIKHPMNVKKIINNCIDELSYIIQEKNHNLVINVDEEIILNIDSERFFEIISNLLSNAVKFTPKNGTIEISAGQKDDNYLFKVKDNGIGLKADELGKLFQKFQKVREYSGENYIKGTGIGLFISKGFVEAHGGKIWATSEGHNQGTTFSFTIPF